MPELGPFGSVRGALSNGRPYRDRSHESVRFFPFSEPTPEGAPTTTGRLVFGIFATLAEFERDLIHERTMAGLAAARARGRADGRPRVMTRKKLKAAIAMMADRDNAARDIAAELGVSLSTLYAYVDAKGKPRDRANELLARGSMKRDATIQG